MMKGLSKNDMIAAIATAPGEGGVAIVRVSGAGSLELLNDVFRPRRKKEIKPAQMRYGHVISAGGDVIDEAMSVYFAAPHSYTAEDIVEIQCHGGTIQAKRVLERVLSAGARLAEPGEFTRRAFENGRIDLPEAEAVLSLIRAEGELSARAAYRQLSGSVAAFIREIRETLTESLALIEATIDFPDEVEEEDAAVKVAAHLEKALRSLDSAIDEKGARAVRSGASVVIAGNPNVGKSSILNAILKRDRAIVSDIPGTTRDVLTENINLGGLMVELSDTAGQRSPGDPIEAIGIKRAKAAQREADLVFLVFDAAGFFGEEEKQLIWEADDRTVMVVNKSDIDGGTAMVEAILEYTGSPPLFVSAATGEGIEKLFDIMKQRLVGYIQGEPILINLRQIQCAKEARQAILRGIENIEICPLDVVSSDIWEALSALAALTGEDAREDVIDRIFQDFCVGK